MTEDQTDARVGSLGSPEPSRALLRLLRTFVTRVEAVRKAELDYHGAVLTESLRSKSKRASGRRVNEAFGCLAEAVVDLQGSQLAVLALAENEGIPAEGVSALDETFESAGREYAGYLAARTYDQVREVVKRGASRGRGS